MNAQDTIVAISSGVGVAARGIVRMSGADALRIARELVKFDGAGAHLVHIFGGVPGWVYCFVAPRSYTGEDLVEFHVPGSPALLRMILDRCVELGARQAEAGEFTARAYFNGRMDLTQAEGVAATIAATSEREMRAARQLLGGELARRLTPIMDDVAAALALVEAGIDFSDEGVAFISADEVRSRCSLAIAALDRLLCESARFERLSHEPSIVLVGRPNAGKSTLLNALAGLARAVVSDVAGTTRDAIWAHVKLARGMVRVVDVAGLEEGSGVGFQGSGEEDIVRQMREQSLREVREADLVVMVMDERGVDVQVDRAIDLVVESKADQRNAEAQSGQTRMSAPPFLSVSAMTGKGMTELCAMLDHLAFGKIGTGSGLALNARHVASIGSARDALMRASNAIDSGAELSALGLREALESLGEVLGRMSADELLGRVFSQFCIGK